MPTKHKKTLATSKNGVNFVRGVVEANNSIFQEVSLVNDVGNDGYIEFIENEIAIGFAIWVQIKAGNSYVKPNGNFVLKADKDHFEYWYSHLMPVAAIIYHPEKDAAVWMDITEYLTLNPNLIQNGPYDIEIPATQIFGAKTFREFTVHFLKYQSKYRSHLGMALEKFADRNSERNCFEGMSYLFSFYRNNVTSWYYMISCFQNFRQQKILFPLTNMLAYLPGHQDIFCHGKNQISELVKKEALAFLNERFGRIEVLCLLEIVTDGGGFTRGAIGQGVLSLIIHLRDIETILESLAFAQDISEDARYWALILLIYFVQENDPLLEKCYGYITRFQGLFQNEDSDINDMVEGVRGELERLGRFYLFC